MRLIEYVIRAGSLKAAAKRIGIAESKLSPVYTHGYCPHKDVADLLDSLGLEWRLEQTPPNPDADVI